MPKVVSNKDRWNGRAKSKLFAVDEEQWNERLKELKQYQQVNGNCKVPQKYKGNPQLGTWVHNQRIKYKNGKLSKERIKLLNKIGFEWESTNRQQMENQRWNTRYNQLVLFNEENGHCRVPGKYPKLGIWVKEQRQLYKKNKLLSDRIELLKKHRF